MKNTKKLKDCHKNMNARCYDDKVNSYHRYGGRGITICDEWRGRENYDTFADWAVNNGYAIDLTIERIDVNGNYEPSNCTWITHQAQCNNRRTNVFIEIDGRTQTIAQWTREYNLPEFTIYQRLKDGKSGIELLATPLKPKADKQSSHKGIRWRNDSSKWEASIWENKRVKVIGSFKTEEEAILRRIEYIEQKEKELNTI